jgi:hypothetical protein
MGGTQEFCVKMSHRGVAGCAFIFYFCLVLGVQERFKTDIGTPEWVLCSVCHHGCAPIIRHIYVIAESIHTRHVGSVVTMAFATLAAAGEKGVVTFRQASIQFHHAEQCHARPGMKSRDSFRRLAGKFSEQEWKNKQGQTDEQDAMLFHKGALSGGQIYCKTTACHAMQPPISISRTV